MKKTKIYKNKKRNFKKKTKKTRKHKIKKMKGGVNNERIINNDYEDMNENALKLVRSVSSKLNKYLNNNSSKKFSFTNIYGFILDFILYKPFHMCVLKVCNMINNRVIDENYIYYLLGTFHQDNLVHMVIFKLLLIIIYVLLEMFGDVSDFKLGLQDKYKVDSIKFYNDHYEFVKHYIKRLTSDESDDFGIYYENIVRVRVCNINNIENFISYFDTVQKDLRIHEDDNSSELILLKFINFQYQNDSYELYIDNELNLRPERDGDEKIIAAYLDEYTQNNPYYREKTTTATTATTATQTPPPQPPPPPPSSTSHTDTDSICPVCKGKGRVTKKLDESIKILIQNMGSL